MQSCGDLLSRPGPDCYLGPEGHVWCVAHYKGKVKDTPGVEQIYCPDERVWGNSCSARGCHMEFVW